MSCERIGPGGPDETTARESAVIIRDLVADGAALGWVDPPGADEVTQLLRDVAGRAPADAALVVARVDGDVAGLGYWTRFPRPTHSRNADVQKVAVSPAHQRQGVAHALMTELVAAAQDADVEILTLDLRGDNTAAMALYESLGFRRYGRIEGFVAVREARYDKLLYERHLV